MNNSAELDRRTEVSLDPFDGPMRQTVTMVTERLKFGETAVGHRLVVTSKGFAAKCGVSFTLTCYIRANSHSWVFTT